jgi:hypothetical protein
MLPKSLKIPLLALAGIAVLGAQTTPIPGKFYEYYMVATTQAGQFTALGAPSINDNGLCAFMGQTSIGQTIWTGDGNMHPLVDINPASGNPGSVTFSPQMQINVNNQVVARDEIEGTSSNIRLWNANAQNSYTYLARAGSGQKYNGTYDAASLNKTGESVFAVISGTTTDLVEDTGGANKTHAVTTGTPQPVVAANGTLVVTTTNTSNELNQVLVFTNNFAVQTTIADGSTFSYLDTAPAISSDGNVIAFQGTLTSTGAAALGTTAGPGIFAAVNTGTAWQIIRVTGLMVEVPNSGGNNNGVCDPGETCVNAAELGYNDNGAAVYFTTYPTNSRIAVVNLGLGAAGIADDSFVIAFVGTPSSASRTNPVLGNFPLLFSNQTGLWTIRVDVENQLSPPKDQVYHPFTAIAVAQIGDQIGHGNIVSSIGVNLQIANAAEDETGTVRTMRRGDHRIAFQVTTTAGAQIIYRANHLDSDQDGLLDHWETTGIDMNQDGVIDLNLAAMGANVNSRDLFLELDWLSDQSGYNFHPAPGVITSPTGTPGSLPRMLSRAPELSGNMYGLRSDGAAPDPIPAGVAMHIDGGSGNDFDGFPLSYNMGQGPLNGGDQIGTATNNTALVEVLYFGAPNSLNVTGVTTRSFQDAKDHYFGSKDSDGRELAFKYGILADHYAFVDSPATTHPIASAGLYQTGLDYIIAGDAVPGQDAGNFVKIVGGTGAGQVLSIKGFSTTNAKEIVVNGLFSPLPDTTSTFVYFSGSSGLSEVFFNNTPDYNSLPGNDLILSLGNWGTNPDGYLMNACTQWRTIAHEMGHTLGLRHGGIDNTEEKGTSYLSLMSYSWQLQCNVVSQVQGYSTTNDPTFNDFANLNHQFPEVVFNVGNTLNTEYGAGDFGDPNPEQNVQDYVNLNGSIDFTKPVVSITSPVANATVGIGGSLTVSITATDNVAVAGVQATFDANGNGVIDANEIVTATSAGKNVYHAQFATVAGSPGVRALTAIATDSSGNIGKVSENLSVVTASAAPVLKTLTPSSATHGGATLNVTIAGTGFVSGCTGNWNGSARKTTFVSSTQIKMAVLSTDITNAGTAQVTATNPAQGGNKSNALTFTIN